MSDNVVSFTGETKLDLPPEKILHAALAADLDDVIVVGCHKDGSLYVAAGPADVALVYWLLSCARREVMRVVE